MVCMSWIWFCSAWFIHGGHTDNDDHLLLEGLLCSIRKELGYGNSRVGGRLRVNRRNHRGQVYKMDDDKIRLVYDGILEGGIVWGDQYQSNRDCYGGVNETLTTSS